MSTRLMLCLCSIVLPVRAGTQPLVRYSITHCAGILNPLALAVGNFRTTHHQAYSPLQQQQQQQRSASKFRGRQTDTMSSVPTIAQVVPGSFVSIVLKADQRTGREVQGRVQDLLTRGNHPRGIKVRLSDGRIGRVQRMVAQTSTAAGRTEETTSRVSATDGMELRSEGQGRSRYRDMRLDQQPEEPPTQHDLAAYIKPAKQKKRRNIAKSAIENELGSNAQTISAKSVASSSATAKCPVCGEFEGDEAAVAHHVETHFV